MASTYWRTGHSVSTLLQSKSVGWDFLQLVRLLLTAANGDENSDVLAIDDQQWLKQLDKYIHFGLSLDSDFPPGEVRHVDYEPQQPSRLTAIHGGLIAPDGPLPEPFVEWLRDLQEQGDSAMLDFLQLFNQRMLALRYLVHRDQCPTLIDAPADHSSSGEFLLALAGNQGNAEDVDDDLALAGLFANCRMSLPIVRHLLRFSLGLNLREMEHLQGGWLTLDSQDVCYLGQQQGCHLGMDTMLGRFAWDQHKGVRFVIGPVDWSRLQQLIPGGEDHQRLVDLLKRISDCHYDCRVSLFCPQAQIPDLRLGQGPQVSPHMSLGLTAFLPVSLEPASSEFQHSLQGDEVEVSFWVESAA